MLSFKAFQQWYERHEIENHMNKARMYEREGVGPIYYSSSQYPVQAGYGFRAYTSQCLSPAVLATAAVSGPILTAS
jgi:hypothetical protein